MVAVGRLADWLTATHPLDDSFGPGTPFARLVEASGWVLVLGAPLRSLTLLHHAEAIARVPDKRRWSYTLPFATADCHLFPAADLVAFATRWLEERFGSRTIDAQANASERAANEPSRNSDATAFTAGVIPYLTWVKM